MQIVQATQDGSLEKKECLQRQCTIFEQLLYLKIKLHTAMRYYNELPRGPTLQILLKEADQSVVDDYDQAHDYAQQLFVLLGDVEKQLLAGRKKVGKRDDDEEIESSDDESQSGKPVEEAAVEEDGSRTARQQPFNWHSALKKLEQNEKEFSSYRNSVVSEWEERTSLAQVADKSPRADRKGILKQVEQILSEQKLRLLARTQTRRVDQGRIGHASEDTVDPEYFDDNDFYGVILRELLEKKGAISKDSASMTRQWLDVQKLQQRNTKKKVDVGASKGRKIRYKAIPRLVNFHAATPSTVSWSHEKRNDLFGSLFTPY